MNSLEYKSWARFHHALFPDFGTWWASLTKDVQDTLRVEWQTILERIPLEDAKAASRRMLSGDVELCPAWERSMLATRIARAARDVALERAPKRAHGEPLLADNGPAFAAGRMFRAILDRVDAGQDPREAASEILSTIPASNDGPRYKCRRCLDSGYVTVWSSISVVAALQGKLDEWRHRKTMVVACSCSAADAFCLSDERTAPKHWHGWRQSARYAPESYCRCPHGDVHNPARIAELVEWVGDYAKKRREAPEHQREVTFDAWNQGSLQLEPAS